MLLLVYNEIDGSNGQVWITNGSGVLSFVDVSSAVDDLTGNSLLLWLQHLVILQ